MVQALQNIPEAPQLPASYPVMMILALCPPLFSHIMDPRAMAYSDKTVNK
jgi:alkane 1-monooxygenase